MRKRTLGVVLLAGLAMSGAGAFTGSNTFSGTQGTKIAGYGEATASGLTITDLNYNLSSDKDQLESVDFVTTTDATGADVNLILKNSGTQVGSAYACTSLLGYLAGSASYTCTVDTDGVTPGNQGEDLVDFNGVGISAVTPN